jgi:hypothetical protein
MQFQDHLREFCSDFRGENESNNAPLRKLSKSIASYENQIILEECCGLLEL